MIPKVAFQKIRKLAKRGSNEMLQRAIEDVFVAGVEAGMRKLSEELKGRINDYQSANPSNDSDGERGESDSPEPIEGSRVNADDEYRDSGSPAGE